MNPFAPELMEEIKVEPLEPLEGGPDPIGQNQLGTADFTEKTDQEDRKPPIVLPDRNKVLCQFCLRVLKEAGGRGNIQRKKIVFVLGVRKWGSPRARPDCCNNCKKMFDLFYDFKRSCLTALARPEFLLACAEKNVSHEVMDLRPVVETLAKKRANRRSRKNPKIKKEETQSGTDGDEADQKTEMPSSGPLSAVQQQPSHHVSDDDVSVVESDATQASKSNSADSKQHGKKIDKERKYCYRCKQFFANEAIYMEHKPSCTKPSRDPPPLACTICPRRFHREDKLMYHMNRHNGMFVVRR